MLVADQLLRFNYVCSICPLNDGYSMHCCNHRCPVVIRRRANIYHDVHMTCFHFLEIIAICNVLLSTSRHDILGCRFTRPVIYRLLILPVMLVRDFDIKSCIRHCSRMLPIVTSANDEQSLKVTSLVCWGRWPAAGSGECDVGGGVTLLGVVRHDMFN